MMLIALVLFSLICCSHVVGADEDYVLQIALYVDKSVVSAIQATGHDVTVVEEELLSYVNSVLKEETGLHLQVVKLMSTNSWKWDLEGLDPNAYVVDNGKILRGYAKKAAPLYNKEKTGHTQIFLFAPNATETPTRI